MGDSAAEVVEEVKQDIFESEEELAQIAETEVDQEEFVRKTQERVAEFESNRARMMSYYVAAGLFFIILVCLLITSSSMMRAYPSMQGFYKLFGIHMELPDTFSVMFEGVKVEREGTFVTASGRIVNLSRKEWVLPRIEIVIFKPVVGTEDGEDEEVIARWIESPPESILGSELEIPFSYTRHVSFGEKTHNEEANKEDVYEEDDSLMVRVHFVMLQPPELEDEDEES